MATYTLRGEGSEIEIQAATLADARAQATAWAEEGDWDTSDGTVYEDVRILAPDGNGELEIIETVTVAIHQPEPRCSSNEGHDWQSPVEIVGGDARNPGVWGNDGGVTISECCMRCGCRRHTNTWAYRRDTGEQGLREVTYTPDYYSDVLRKYEEAV